VLPSDDVIDLMGQNRSFLREVAILTCAAGAAPDQILPLVVEQPHRFEATDRGQRKSPRSICQLGGDAPVVHGAQRLGGLQSEQPANRIDAWKLEEGGAAPGQGVTIGMLAGDRANLERVPCRRFPAVAAVSPRQSCTSQLGDPPHFIIEAS